MSSFPLFSQPRKAGLRVLAVLSLLAVAACDALPLDTAGTGPRIDTSQPVPVALLVPRGSAQPSDALLARNLENAARLAMADLNGVDIDLRVYETAGNAQQAAAQASRAVKDGAKIILGPVYAASANAAGLAVVNEGVNVLSFSNNTTIAGGNVFVLGPTFENTANRLVQYAARQGKSRIVTVHSRDVAGEIGKAAIDLAAAQSRATVVASVPYTLSQKGVAAAVPQVRNAVNNTGADVVFMTSNTAAALPLLSQLLPEAGVNPAVTQFVGLTRWDIPAQTLSLPGVQGGWFALPDPVRTSRYRTRYEAAYGTPPHPISGLAYDGIAAIGALVRTGRSNALTAQALTQNSGFEGVSGIFRLRENGTNQRGLAVATIRDKRVVVVDQAPRGFRGAGF